MGKRKRYTSEEKVKILRELLEDGKPVSQVAESHGIHPNLILNWRKQLFEGAPKTFEARRPVTLPGKLRNGRLRRRKKSYGRRTGLSPSWRRK